MVAFSLTRDKSGEPDYGINNLANITKKGVTLTAGEEGFIVLDDDSNFNKVIILSSISADYYVSHTTNVEYPGPSDGTGSYLSGEIENVNESLNVVIFDLDGWKSESAANGKRIYIKSNSSDDIQIEIILGKSRQ